MSTILGQRYLTTWRGTPPHMLKQDIPVWWRFLDQEGQRFKALYYDSYLGGAYVKPADENDPLKVMWRANTAKRTDAIAELAKEIWLIEVSDYPGMRAIGQLITYQTLWIEDPKINKIERLCIVCTRIDTDIAAAAAKIGILIFICP
jgi:hypothetical protein